MSVINHFVIVRPFKPGDEMECKRLINNSIIFARNITYRKILFKEISFIMMFLSFAISFIFFSIPVKYCFCVIPIIILVLYILTYLSFIVKMVEIEEEITNISSVYMSNKFSCFWVAEAYEPYLMIMSPKDSTYIVTTMERFNSTNINVSQLRKKIVGTISLSKHQHLQSSAWLKRLYVDERYRRKGIATRLLNVALDFAQENRYRYVDIMVPEHIQGGRDFCYKNDFVFKLRYYKDVLGPLVTMPMSIYTLPISGLVKKTSL